MAISYRKAIPTADTETQFKREWESLMERAGVEAAL